MRNILILLSAIPKPSSGLGVVIVTTYSEYRQYLVLHVTLSMFIQLLC